VDQKDADKIVPYIDIEFKGDVIYKNRMMMLDIIANNNWERPIYFSGGSFGDDDYLWMKDYLQLDGVVYKLVPVHTPIDRNNPFDMGRIDSDKMYDVVMKWDWGNSGDPDIYHDVETRRNGITYRSNLARLADKLIVDGKLDKAENILDLAMKKMPVEKFEFYSLLEPFVLSYYNIDKPKKAREVYEATVKQYQDHLLYYSGLHLKHQNAIFDEIYSDLGRYRALIEILVDHDNEEFAKKEATKFNGYLRLFDSSPSEDSLINTEDDNSDPLENELDTISDLNDDTIN